MIGFFFGVAALWAGGVNITFEETWTEFKPQPEAWALNVLDLSYLPGQGLLVLDGQEKRILCFGKGGELKKAIARKGEGPGELREPMAILAKKDRLLVYDAGKGAILRYNWNGDFQDQVSVERGSSALFSQNYLVVQTLMRGSRFRLLTHEGEELIGFGGNIDSIKNIMERVKLIGMMAVDETRGKLNVFRASGLVQEVYEVQSGELVGEYDVSLDQYSKASGRPKVENGLVRLDAKLPVKAVTMLGERPLVLVQDENASERTLLVLFDDRGRQLGFKETPLFFRQMFARGHDFFFYDQEHGQLKAYRLSFSD